MPTLTLQAPPAAVDVSVTYAEIRWWAVLLQLFTASDLADAMAVNVAVAQRGIKALLWHGICEDTGDQINGEAIISYVPLPPGPREHPTMTPVERIVGYTDIVCPRGLPVRIRTERQMRRSLSTPGARQKHKDRERAYQRQQEARERAKLASAARAKKEPKWKRPKGGAIAVDW